jgi:hypothetical protein
MSLYVSTPPQKYGFHTNIGRFPLFLKCHPHSHLTPTEVLGALNGIGNVTIPLKDLENYGFNTNICRFLLSLPLPTLVIPKMFIPAS